MSSKSLLTAALKWSFLPMVAFGFIGPVSPASANSAPQSTESSSASNSQAEPKEGDTSGDSVEKEVVEYTKRGEEREWLFDEENGREYSIERVPKIEKAYKWVSEDKVRLPGGVAYEVVDFSDQHLWVKVYRPRKLKKRVRPVNKPDEEALAAVAKSYETAFASADRLRLVPFDKGLPKAGQWRNGFDVADMNADGHLDIVFGPSRKGRPAPNIYLGDSQGSWQRWSAARFPQEPYDYGDAAAGDFNGDGHLDLAFGFHLRGMLALLNDGNGVFKTWSEGIELDNPGAGGDATSFSSRAVTTIDWNQDGRLDILALGEGPKGYKTKPNTKGRPLINTSRGMLVYLNQGDGTWKPQRIERSFQDFGDSFAFGDFNQDGAPDIAIASHVQGNRAILRQSTKDGGRLESVELELLRPGAFLTAVTVADLDKDGLQDLVIGYRNREMEVWRTGVDILFASKSKDWTRVSLIAEESLKGVPAIDTGDLDGDGHVDIVALTGEGEVWAFTGQGQREFSYEISPESPRPVAGCQGWDVHLVDLDRDGGAEIIAGFAGERSGMVGIAELTEPGCSRQGSIGAWKVVLAKETPEDTSAETVPTSR